MGDTWDSNVTSHWVSLVDSMCVGVHICMCRNVPVGEASVIIAISSKHRKESLEAVEFAINTLKATVPIWKKVRIISFCNVCQYSYFRKFMKMEKQNGSKTKNVSGWQIHNLNNYLFNVIETFVLSEAFFLRLFFLTQF